MIRASNYTGKWFNPAMLIRRFETVIASHGLSKAESGRFRREREGWISAVWSLGIRRITGLQYWIEIETADQTPDCKVHFLDQSSGNNHRMTMNVEVVEWDEHRQDLMEIIAQKCARAYPKYFFLVVLVRSGNIIELGSVLQRLTEARVPFAEIWILGRISPITTEYRMVQLHPYSKDVRFDLVKALQDDRRECDIIQPLQRGKGTEFQRMGITYLPIE